MYNTNGRQYIVKTSSGQYFNIYYKPYTGLCLSKQTDNGTWTFPYLILKNALPGFGVCLDTKDNIHVFCQDENGDLLYGNNTDSTWCFQTVLKNKSEEFYDKYPFICHHDDNLYFFYTIDNAGKRVLYCQECRTGDVYAPRVVDYVKKHTRIFTAKWETQNRLHIFYIKPSVKGEIIGYRTLNLTDGALDDFSELKDIKVLSDQQALYISAVCHDKENLHLCLQKAVTQKYELVYAKISNNKENCSYETTLATSPYPFTHSSLLVIGKRLVAYWVREESIYCCTSADYGNTWSKPERYHALDGQPFHCIRVISNVPDDDKNLDETDLPANISNGFHPAFLNDFKDRKEDNKEMEDNKTPISNPRSIVVTSIEEINKSIREAENAINKFNTKIQNFEELLEKHSASICSTKEEISKVGAELEVLKTAVETIRKSETEKEVKTVENATETKDENNDKSINKNNRQSEYNRQSVLPGTGFSHITYDYLRKMKSGK